MPPGGAYSYAQVGLDAVVSVDGGGQIILQNISLASIQAGWIFS